MRSSHALSIALAALLLTSTTPISTPLARSVAAEPSPVRCRAGDRNEQRPHHAPQALSLPSIAPPPPPPHVSMDAATESVVVTSRVAPGIAPGGYIPSPDNRERYAGKDVAAVRTVADAPVSTFSVDVDTGSYANVRRFLNQGQLPPQAAVRTEEMLNYFRYDYPRPAGRAEPFSVTADMATTPWNDATRLLRIGLRGYDLDSRERPAANLVFLVDVSGSMDQPDKLPLVKTALKLVANRLSPRDHVSIVVYAGAAGIVLDPTSEPRYVKAALDCLEAGGSTAGGQGIELAYATARAHRIDGGINRVILATDGDFNVGLTDTEALVDLIERNREDGITLTTLGFGQGNYNEALMERTADVGNGNYAYIDSASEAQKVLDEELSSTLFTIAKDVKIQVEFNPAHVAEYRLIGYENRALAEEDFDNDAVDAGDIGAGHQVTALYEIVPAGAKGWLPDRRYDANRRSAEAGWGGELAFVKLRYKLPDGETSKLIERPVPAMLVRDASAPRGDMAFATAVAAFGQRLRGDKHLNGYSLAQIRGLAGSPANYWRQEFVRLATVAEAQQPSHVAGSE